MKALTVRQPWASLIACDAKRVETRSWSAHYRGPLAIHAAVGFGHAERELADTRPFVAPLAIAGFRGVSELPLGAIVAVAHLHDVIPTYQRGRGPDDPLAEALARGDEEAFGDYSLGRFAWMLRDVVALDDPISCRGVLGLWEPRLVADPSRPCELDEESFDRLNAAFARLAHPCRTIPNRELEGER